MSWNYYVYYFFSILSFWISVYSVYNGLKIKSSKSQVYYVLSALSISIISLANIISIQNEDLESMMIGIKISYVAKSLCVLFLSEFIITYCNGENKKIVQYAGIMINVIIISMILTFDHNKLFFTRYKTGEYLGIPVFIAKKGIGYYCYIIYNCVMSLGIVHVIVRKLRYCRMEREKKKYQSMLVGCSMAVVAMIVNALELFSYLDILPAMLGLSCGCYLYVIKKYNIFDISQNAKEYVLDHAEEAIIVVNPEYEVLYFNPIVKEWLCPEIELYMKLGTEILRFYESKENRFQINGRTFEFQSTEVYHEKGELEGYLFEAHDITEDQRRMEEMNDLMVEAEVANQAKSAFLMNMSHGIRTPVNVILGMNEMIQRESGDPTILDYSDSIDNAGKTLISIINDILDFSKIEMGKVEIEPQVYEVENILTNSRNLIEPRLESKPISFEQEVTDSVPTKLYGDQNRVQQVITNILTNAVKYTDKGKIYFKINARDLGMRDKQKWVLLEVSVADTGKGIKRENLNKLFISFQRVDEENNRNIEGTGLGLAITKRLLERMDGNIRVESEYGKGSTFTVMIPQVVVDPEPYNASHSKDKERTIKKRYKSSFEAENAHILIADDNAVNLKVFCNLLKRTKVSITTVDSGKEAIEAVRKTRFDMIFLDHMMPEMDGVETLQYMKTMEDNLCKDVPVLVLTANAIQGAKEIYLEKGFDDYIMKPIDTKILEQMMIRYLPKELVTLKE